VTAATSPTISSSDFLAVVEEHLPAFDPPALPGPRLNPREAAAALLSLLAPTAVGTARLADYRHRENGGQTMQIALADDISDSIASVRKPLRVGPRPEPFPSWFISLNEARRIDRISEQQFLPVTVVLSMSFLEPEPADLPSEVTWPLVLSAELIAALAGLFTRESLYSA
jgi:hypothetical protein